MDDIVTTTTVVLDNKELALIKCCIETEKSQTRKLYINYANDDTTADYCRQRYNALEELYKKFKKKGE